MEKSTLNNLEKYPKKMGEHTFNTPKKNGEIPQNFGKIHFINYCNTNIYTTKKRLETKGQR